MVESARRAVLRDLRDTSPSHWQAVAEDWGQDSSFYAHMATHHPQEQLSAAKYQMLAFETESAMSYDLEAMPLLAQWTALTLDDMTGQGTAEQGEQYHLARGKAETDGYEIVHWTKVMALVQQNG
eukprot:COSAG01_NODE_5230_length_4396_cov_11.017575_4_plen_125_part_00